MIANINRYFPLHILICIYSEIKKKILIKIWLFLDVVFTYPELEPLLLMRTMAATIKATPTRGPPIMRAQVKPLYLHLVLREAEVSQYSNGFGQLSTSMPPPVPVHNWLTFLMADPVMVSLIPPMICLMLPWSERSSGNPDERLTRRTVKSPSEIFILRRES